MLMRHIRVQHNLDSITKPAWHTQTMADYSEKERKAIQAFKDSSDTRTEVLHLPNDDSITPTIAVMNFIKKMRNDGKIVGEYYCEFSPMTQTVADEKFLIYYRFKMSSTKAVIEWLMPAKPKPVSRWR